MRINITSKGAQINPSDEARRVVDITDWGIDKVNSLSVNPSLNASILASIMKRLKNQK